jgi:Yip1-like protein
MSEMSPPRGGLEASPPPLHEPPPLVIPPPVISSLPAGAEEPLVPWIAIWTRPRAALRRVLDGGAPRAILRLAALGGIAEALTIATDSGYGDTHSPWVVLAMALPLGVVGGILALAVLTWLVRLAGLWLGGRGERMDVMTALAWSCVPAIWGLLLWLPRAALLGEETFRSAPAGIEENPPAALFLGLLGLVQVIMALWGTLITLKCIAEAHRFSAWRALGAFILAGLAGAVPVLLLLTAARVVN